MIGIILFLASLFAGLGVWLFGIRPHLSRHGGVVSTGINYYVSAWADWQQCRELARVKNDIRALSLSRYFTLAQLAFVVGAILAICRI